MQKDSMMNIQKKPHMVEEQNASFSDDGAIKRTFEAIYMGSAKMDRRYSQSVQPWVMAEIRRRKTGFKEVNLQVLTHNLKCTACDAHGIKDVFDHKLKDITRFAKLHQDPRCFAYLRRQQLNNDFECHMFTVQDEILVPQLFHTIQVVSKETDQERESDKYESDAAFGSGHPEPSKAWYEVMYVGRAKLSSKKVPTGYIDELVDKLHAKDEERRIKKLEESVRRPRNPSGNSVRSLPGTLEEAIYDSKDDILSQKPMSIDMNISSVEIASDYSRECSVDDLAASSTENITDGHNEDERHDLSNNCYTFWKGDSRDVFYDQKPKFHGEINRTMLLQIGPIELSFISLDKKLTILQKKYKDISFVSQGNTKLDVFGIIARESSTEFICHILKCHSESVVTDIMNTLQSAFTSAFEKSLQVQPSSQHQICVMCPLHQLHKLCQEIQGLRGHVAHELLVRRVQNLPEVDYSNVLEMLKDENPATHEEMVELIMISLRKVCERKQNQHVHISGGTKKYTPQFNLLEDKHKFFDNFRSKARKSLATSFENLIRGKKKDDAREGFRKRSWTSESDQSRKGSVESTVSSPEASPLPSPVPTSYKHTFPSPPVSPEAPRKRSSTVGAIPDPAIEASRRNTTENVTRYTNKRNSHSPIKNIFLFASSPQSIEESFVKEPTPSLSVTPCRQRKTSWRQEIFNRVVTPAHISETSTKVGCGVDGWKSSSTELRALWKKAILETLLLIRMEKENHCLMARQDEAQLKRNKLDYVEVTPCLRDVTREWEDILINSEDEKFRFNMETLFECVGKGVPQCYRGAIWKLLWKQHVLHNRSLDAMSPPCVEYFDLLKQLTTHQHAILIDLGRTFPGHPYFSVQLGPGQLELFNILKAYSLLDTEVGYCQGLSFIAGILIMHMEEIDAFDSLKYILFNLGMRVQYRPNMIALQIKLYQLTRLIHDHYKDLYEHFEKYEIGPTLYAAPWFLTLFASQFPLGFVARVFDLLFLQGVDVIYKVALLLLGTHKELIMQCDSFESIVDFLKTTLPQMVEVQMERVVNQAFVMDISKELQAYEVEYHVLREEMIHSSKRGDSDLVHNLEKVHRKLRQQNMELLEKLQQAHSQQHSLSSALHDAQVNEANLKSRIQTLEIERSALLNTVAKLRCLIPDEELNKLNLSSSLFFNQDPNIYCRSSSNESCSLQQNTDLSPSVESLNKSNEPADKMPLAKHNSC